MDMMNENVIEFYRNQKTATVTFCQGRYVTKIKKIAEERPDECEIVAENPDGSIVAHVPTKWVRITPSRVYTDEERQRLKEQLAKRFGTKTEDIDDEDIDDEPDDEDLLDDDEDLFD